jgi:hypothetical protein
LGVHKQAAQKFDGEGFNLRKVKDMEDRKQYQNKIPKKYAALENLNNNEDINRPSENIKEKIKTSAKQRLSLYELKQHKPRFDDECLRFLNQRKQATMQWLQNKTKVT